MDTITKVATTAEAVVHDELSLRHSDPFMLESARLYAVSYDSTGKVTTTEVASHPDIYSLLYDTDPDLLTSEGVEFVLVVTTGWAAPLNKDGEAVGAPSRHPERRRVRLMVCASRDSVASVLRFADDPENIVVDEGAATGSLNDAVREFAGRL